MKVKVQPRPQTIEQARAELFRRLEARHTEIEAAVMTRVYAVSDTNELDPTYAEGLKAAVSAAVDYGFAAIELGEDRSEPPPPILLVQARMAARARVRLDTVLRRYFAGHALLSDFLIEEAERGRLLRGAALQKLLRTQAAIFDRLLAAVSEEHRQESDSRLYTSEQRRAEQVDRLLAGELVDTSEIAYDFEGHHIAMIAKGPGVEDAIRELGARLDRSLLVVRREENTVWVWLGGRRPADPDELEGLLAANWPAEVILSLGESAPGPAGWRLSHRQARAALPIATRNAERITRYSDVALLASMLQDELLSTSLRDLYLVPLEADRDGGATLQRTLRAYFSCDRNSASTAAALGVTRQTVNNRLRVVEQYLERPLRSCSTELEIALNLDSFDPSNQRPLRSIAGLISNG